MTGGTAHLSDSYLLGNNDEEIRHLVSQAEVYASEANELFDRIGVRTGSSVADIGCGVLGVLHLLRDRVGPTGRVIGVDREPRMLDAARGLAAARDLAVDLVQGDAMQLDIGSNTLDLAHERTVLLNVSEPERVVAEMVRVVRPGGVVAIQEPDASSWVCDPPHPAWETLRDAVVETYASTGKTFNRGRTCPSMLRGAGLDDVRVRVTARATRPGEYYHTFLLSISALVRESLTAAHGWTSDDFDWLHSGLAAHLAHPETITCQPTMWQAWGTKP